MDAVIYVIDSDGKIHYESFDYTGINIMRMTKTLIFESQKLKSSIRYIFLDNFKSFHSMLIYDLSTCEVSTEFEYNLLLDLFETKNPDIHEFILRCLDEIKLDFSTLPKQSNTVIFNDLKLFN